MAVGQVSGQHPERGHDIAGVRGIPRPVSARHSWPGCAAGCWSGTRAASLPRGCPGWFRRVRQQLVARYTVPSRSSAYPPKTRARGPVTRPARRGPGQHASTSRPPTRRAASRGRPRRPAAAQWAVRWPTARSRRPPAGPAGRTDRQSRPSQRGPDARRAGEDVSIPPSCLASSPAGQPAGRRRSRTRAASCVPGEALGGHGPGRIEPANARRIRPSASSARAGAPARRGLARRSGPHVLPGLRGDDASRRHLRAVEAARLTARSRPSRPGG